MGSRDGNPNEQPRHLVEISQGFWLARTPTTLAQFQRFRPQHRNNFSKDVPDDPRHPVIDVTWHDASAYCQWLTDQVLSQRKDWKSFRARLPTEAEWERACRGPAGDSLVETEYWSGDGESALEPVGWFDGNSAGRLQPVGQKPANTWELCDMHGLVWEWCLDQYDSNAYQGWGYVDTETGVVAASDDRNAQRVLRGGSWNNSAANCRSAIRNRNRADNRNRNNGFRLAVVPGTRVHHSGGGRRTAHVPVGVRRGGWGCGRGDSPVGEVARSARRLAAILPDKTRRNPWRAS
jgi:formylglycine-generating enzyme required for sulfatase activity